MVLRYVYIASMNQESYHQIVIPDRCIGCPMVGVILEPQPANVTPKQANELVETFRDCPGYKGGVRGMARSAFRQMVEAMGAGPVIPMVGEGKVVAMEVIDEGIAKGCGSSARTFVEIERGGEFGFEPADSPNAGQSRITGKPVHLPPFGPIISRA